MNIEDINNEIEKLKEQGVSRKGVSDGWHTSRNSTIIE